jgi:hypothetical protein
MHRGQPDLADGSFRCVDNGAALLFSRNSLTPWPPRDPRLDAKS